jgi:hypothetical protein
LGNTRPSSALATFLFVSAKAGVDPATGKVTDGGIAAECHQVLTIFEPTRHQERIGLRA